MWTWFRNDGLYVENDLGNLFVISTFPIISLLHRSHLQLINLAKIPETGDWRYWGMEIMGRHYHQHYHQHLNHYHHHHHHQKHLHSHCHHHFSTVLIYTIINRFTASCLENYNEDCRVQPKVLGQGLHGNQHHHLHSMRITIILLQPFIAQKFYQIVPTQFWSFPLWHIISSCWITIM